MERKAQLLQTPITPVDITKFDSSVMIEQFGATAFQARNLARAARIYDDMVKDKDCTVILCLAGSIFSAGYKKVIYDLIANNLIDAVVSTGALIVDQDFFEALGFRHYQASPQMDDEELQELHIDRIYDHVIDEDELRECDFTVGRIADSLQPRPYSSREFIRAMGEYLEENGHAAENSIVYACYQRDIPIFVPAFSDCSAGFGLVHHQVTRGKEPAVTIDSVADFRELTEIKCKSNETGLLMIGGGVPKNFAQDITVAAEILGHDVAMHKYAVQITVADERDGALSGSTLQEAHSWGKVDSGNEQMVFCEATIALPLLASYVYHRNLGTRRGKKLQQLFR